MINYEFAYGVGDYVELIDKHIMSYRQLSEKVNIGRVWQVQKSLCGNTSYIVRMGSTDGGRSGEFAAEELRLCDPQPKVP